MGYKFATASGNIVRPIEAACLNTSTGALITPLVYGPAGTAISGWNGAIESVSSALRATSASYTGTTPTNPTYAYDTSAASVDTATYSSLTSSNGTTSTQTYSFAAGTSSATLRIALKEVFTERSVSSDYSNEVGSTVKIELSLDGGTNYLGTLAGQSFNQVSEFGEGDTATNAVLTKTLSAQNMANLKVKATLVSGNVGSGGSQAIAEAILRISDIVVY